MTVFHFSSIITLRIIMIISAQIISAAGDFWSVQNCAKLLDVIGDAQTLVEQYPSCSSLIDDGNLKAVAAVNANFGGSTAELMSALNISFGMAGWLATSLHAIGVEVYVSCLRDVLLCVPVLMPNSFTLLPRNLSVFARCPTNGNWKLGSRTLGTRAWSLGILRSRLWLVLLRSKQGSQVRFLVSCLKVTKYEYGGGKYLFAQTIEIPGFYGVLFQHGLNEQQRIFTARNKLRNRSTLQNAGSVHMPARQSPERVSKVTKKQRISSPNLPQHKSNTKHPRPA